MEIALTLLSLAVVILLLTSIIYVMRLTFVIETPGIGRIIFLSLASLKLWVALVLGYFLINSHNLDILFTQHREEVRLFLALYVVVQATAVNIALWRWDRQHR